MPAQGAPPRFSDRAAQIADRSAAPVVVLAAPAGFGKAELARRIVDLWQPGGMAAVERNSIESALAATTSRTIEIIRTGQRIDGQAMDALLKAASERSNRYLCILRTSPAADIADGGDILVLDPSDLSLDRDETRDLLEWHAPGRFDRDAVEDIFQDTAGWLAAIEVAAAPRDVVPNAGSKYAARRPARQPLDFFKRRVLAGLSASQREFLSAAAELDLLSIRLVGDLMGGDAADHFAFFRDTFRLLVATEKEGFLRLPGILRRHITAEQPLPDAARTDLLQGAADWHLSADMADLAIDYLLRAGRPGDAAQIFSSHGPRIRVQTGDNPKMLRWLDRMVRLGWKLSPDLQLWRVWALVYSLRLKEAESGLKAVYEELDEGDRRNHSFAERLQVSIAARHGDIDLTQRLGEAWLDHWSESDPVQGGGVALLLALVHAYRQDDRPCRRMLLFARQYAVQGSNVAANLWVMGVEAIIELEAGRAALAADIIERAQSTAARSGGVHSPISQMLAVVAAAIQLEMGDAETAAENLDLGYAGTPGYGLPITHLASQEAMARFTERTRGVNAALLSVHQEGINTWRYVLSGHLRAVQVLVRAGRIEEARVRIDAAQDLLPKDEDERMIREVRATEAWVLHAEGQHERAKALLMPLLSFADARGQRRWFVSLLLLRAATEWAQDDARSARQCFSRALRIAVTGQLQQTVVEMGWALRHLLSRLVEEDELSREAEQFLDVVADRLGVSRPDATIQPPGQPLTERECEVLRMLDSGLRAGEVAARLNIGVTTLKWHIQNIYGKLNVRNRPGAIAAARRFHLI